MFYKLENDKIIKAPKKFRADGKDVFTNSEKFHNEHGFYKLIREECPQDDKIYKSYFELVGNKIIQKWEETEVTE